MNLYGKLFSALALAIILLPPAIQAGSRIVTDFGSSWKFLKSTSSQSAPGVDDGACETVRQLKKGTFFSLSTLDKYFTI